MFTSVVTINENPESYRLLNWVITYVIRKQIIYNVDGLICNNY